MTRESTKHGPNLDEQMEDEVKDSNVAGGVESRAREDRVLEDATDRPFEGLRSETQRSVIARYLRPSIFPADKQAVLREAEDNHAVEGVVRVLRELPEGRRFQNVEAVWETLGGYEEKRF